MNELTIILMSLLGNEDPGSTDYVIADYILKNVESLAKVSTSTLAENCNVSKASISRFCKKIGLEDFFELKYLIKKHLPGKIISQKYAFEGNNVTESLNFLNESIKNIEYMRDTLDLNLMNELVTDIYTYEKTTLMGSQQSVGTVLILQNDLSTFSKFVKVCGEPKNQYELLKNATDDELIVIFSAKGKFFDRVLSQKNILNRKNIPKIYLITVSDVELPPFVNKKIQLYDKYNYSSNILFTLYVALIAINYKQAYLNA